MSKEIEIEFKSMLTNDEYQQLLHHYAITDDSFVVQTNLYFDTRDFQLKQHGMGLRIRRFSTKAEATLKVPQTIGLLEITDTLTLTDAQRALQKEQFPSKATEIHTKLQDLGISLHELHLIGELTTKRSEFSIAEGKLALDESWYSNHHDFELELEVSDAAYVEANFKEFLKKMHLPYRKTQNKIVRAVAARQSRDKKRRDSND